MGRFYRSNRQGRKPATTPPKPTITSFVENGAAGYILTFSAVVGIGDDTQITGAFTFTASGGAMTLSTAVPLGDATVVGNLSRNPASNETITFAYQPQASANNRFFTGSGPTKTYVKSVSVGTFTPA